MSVLPDELWRLILEAGIETFKLSYKDLCCISISCRRLHRLSDEDSLWSRLLSSDFPTQPQNPAHPSTSSSSAKSAYRIRFGKEREKRIAAHRRAVLRKESAISECKRKVKAIENRLREETERIRAAASELSNLHKVRQASVALNVWQPEVVRGRQRQIVQQCTVPVESRLRSLEMELELCRKQISGLDKAYSNEKKMLEAAKEELASMKYHPLRDYSFTGSQDDKCNRKNRKLKTCSKCKLSLAVLSFFIFSYHGSLLI
ncbi:hypothetical protein Tsubulata_003873 [Turnera subulata]|uniref:F-box domain-containing protein n=1 Tax=Turnera subulata TaxID=218843 RepID=A0A9Q0FLK1_9ROSI|nr:hypothetical protein Tsubulata_003873 [Turnera subulata]